MYTTRRRITEGMSMKEAIQSLSSSNWQTATLLSKLLHTEPLQRTLNVLALDELGIYGRQLHVFLTVCCQADFSLLNDTLHSYREGYLSEDEILNAIHRKKQILYES